MLPKQYRLRADKDIKLVFKKGRRIETPLLRFQALHTGAEQTRFAVVVSTKIGKRATTRNLIKRRTREILRKNVERIKPGFDVVAQARSASVTYATEKIKGKKTPHEYAASYEALEASINQFIDKLNIQQ